LYGLKGLNIVGFDVVELAPAYDTNGMSSSPDAPDYILRLPAEISAIAAADVVYDYLALLSMGVDSGDAKPEGQRDEL